MQIITLAFRKLKDLLLTWYMCIEKFIYITSAFCIYPPPPLHLSRCLLQANASLILFFSSYKVPFHTRNTHIILMFVLRVILLAALIVQIQAENESNVLIFTMNTFYLFSMLTVVVVERVARLLGGQTQKKMKRNIWKRRNFSTWKMIHFVQHMYIQSAPTLLQINTIETWLESME